ncbi:microtubule motor protein [Aureococcus anophagefferens]|uniref:Kinesin-like protein n=1 Tax=Aureococcus anophagefferens TaxID=44056 RepID=A0ABR1FLI7_AURAN
MAVLFELLPFYNQGNRGTDGVQYGHDDLADLLLRRGAEVNAVSAAGVTALAYACGSEAFSEPMIRLLLSREADANVAELHYGCCALHYLAATGDARLCGLLVEHGADAAAVDWYGWAPADYATDAGHDEAAAALRALAERPRDAPKRDEDHQLSRAGSVSALLAEAREDAARAVAKAREEVGDKARKLEAELEKTVAALGACEFEKKALLRKLDDQAGDVGALRRREEEARARRGARSGGRRDAEACAAARARADDADRARASAEQHVRDVDAEIRHAAVVEKRNDQLDRDLVKEVKRRKELHNTLEDMKGRIRVYLRVRPLSTKETEAGAEPACGRAGATGVTVKRADRKPPQDKQHFEFDRVFAGDAEENSQQTVFADVKSLVLSCVDGFNVCIFAYGQSGSGKTFTMAGAASIREAIDVETWNLAPLAGIIPRSAVEVFRMLEERSALAAYEVELSMYELYRDSLRDLFAAPVRKGAKPVALNVKLAQFSDSGLVQVEGGVTRRVQSLPDLVAALEAGLEGRSVAHTELNAESSRSHLIVTLVLKSTNHRSGHVVCGKLTLVDLAGSERVEKSGVAGDKLKEAMSINKSLSAIGDVINALSSGQKHVPYRNHPLTMLMSDSIGGSAKTLMFVNASPADTHVSETVSSLTFGSRCKRVKNASNANGEMASQLKDLKAELDRMKQSGATRAKKAHAPGDVRRPGGNR